MTLDNWRQDWFGNIRGGILAGLVVALALIFAETDAMVLLMVDLIKVHGLEFLFAATILVFMAQLPLAIVGLLESLLAANLLDDLTGTPSDKSVGSRGEGIDHSRHAEDVLSHREIDQCDNLGPERSARHRSARSPAEAARRA